MDTVEVRVLQCLSGIEPVGRVEHQEFPDQVTARGGNVVFQQSLVDNAFLELGVCLSVVGQLV